MEGVRWRLWWEFFYAMQKLPAIHSIPDHPFKVSQQHHRGGTYNKFNFGLPFASYHHCWKLHAWVWIFKAWISVLYGEYKAHRHPVWELSRGWVGGKEESSFTHCGKKRKSETRCAVLTEVIKHILHVPIHSMRYSKSSGWVVLIFQTSVRTLEVSWMAFRMAIKWWWE